MIRLKVIVRARWTLYAVCAGRNECPLEMFLADRTELGKDKDRMLRRLEAIAEHGPQYLPDISHQIEPDLWQTEQGRIRILWFYDRDRVIVCSHGFVKRTRKTPETEKAQARRKLHVYRAAADAGTIRIMEEE
jgi:phage-related protein